MLLGMTIFQAVAAGLSANMLTVLFCYVLWRVGLFERDGKEPSILMLLVLSAVPLLMSYGFWTIN